MASEIKEFLLKPELPNRNFCNYWIRANCCALILFKYLNVSN